MHAIKGRVLGMRRALCATALIAIAATCSALAEPEVKTLTVTTGTNAAATVTDTWFMRGTIDEVIFDVVTAGSTGTLFVVADQALSTLADVTIASNTACAADTIVRPRFDGTGTDGTALTNDPPWMYSHVGTLTFGCTSGNVTGRTFKAVIKYFR